MKTFEFPAKLDPQVLWVWYSWSVSHQKWVRSCFSAPTKAEAVAMRTDPEAMCSELDLYHNMLVEEATLRNIAITETPRRKPGHPHP